MEGAHWGQQLPGRGNAPPAHPHRMTRATKQTKLMQGFTDHLAALEAATASMLAASSTGAAEGPGGDGETALGSTSGGASEDQAGQSGITTPGGGLLGTVRRSRWPRFWPISKEQVVHRTMARRLGRAGNHKRPHLPWLFPIVVAVHIWADQFCNSAMRFWCDNVATVQVINRQTSKSPRVMRCSTFGSRLPTLSQGPRRFLSGYGALECRGTRGNRGLNST
ncbi:uncharacterized protein LOC128347934 [Hemicordylus capensis]|uniref:uncharacterized protein LOC128347934 n=1 Tax=Hemicordylus capensis TaxID=884348 RepID=UPI0023027F27|nr:uncharacterized protein LOC128347934 [Hemicordylus capensis]